MARRPAREVPDELEEHEKQGIVRWHYEAYPEHFRRRGDRTAFLRQEWGKARDWCLANDRRYRDYAAFFRNWLRESMNRRGFEPYRPPSSKPNPRGKKPFRVQREMESISGQLTLIAGGKK